MEKITEKNTLAEVLEIKGAEKVLAKHDLPCLQCPFAKMEAETLEIGKIAKLYRLDLENLLKDLNNLKGQKE